MAKPENAGRGSARPPKRNWAKFFLVVVLPLLLFAGLVKYAAIRLNATERAMHEAVISRDLPRVRWLLRIRPSLIDANDVAGGRLHWVSDPSSGSAMAGSYVTLHRSILFTAVENDDADMIAFLVSQGADIMAEDYEGGSLLTAAVKDHRPKAAEVLLRLGLKFEPADLIDAARRSDTTSLELLLQHGANPNVKSTDGRTALSLAAELDSEPAVKMLLDAGADPNADPNTLLVAREHSSPGIVDLLISSGAK